MTNDHTGNDVITGHTHFEFSENDRNDKNHDLLDEPPHHDHHHGMSSPFIDTRATQQV
jgi:hypothetical protein